MAVSCAIIQPRSTAEYAMTLPIALMPPSATRTVPKGTTLTQPCQRGFDFGGRSLSHMLGDVSFAPISRKRPAVSKSCGSNEQTNRKAEPNRQFAWRAGGHQNDKDHRTSQRR